jgi:hypothetical protein
MAIKNYTSDKPIAAIFAELQQALATRGAKQISYEYADDGKVHGVAFAVKIHDQLIRVKLPAGMPIGQVYIDSTLAILLETRYQGK